MARSVGPAVRPGVRFLVERVGHHDGYKRAASLAMAVAIPAG